MLFCSSVSTWTPRSFSSSHVPRKHWTSVTPVFGSYPTLIQVPLGDAVPAGVTTLTGFSPAANPSSSRNIFPCSNSIIVVWSRANWPRRHTVLGVVLVIRRNSLTRMSTRASLSGKVLTPSPGIKSCPTWAGRKLLIGAAVSLRRSVSTLLMISCTDTRALAGDGVPLSRSKNTTTAAMATMATTKIVPKMVQRRRLDIAYSASLSGLLGFPPNGGGAIVKAGHLVDVNWLLPAPYLNRPQGLGLAHVADPVMSAVAYQDRGIVHLS